MAKVKQTTHYSRYQELYPTQWTPSNNVGAKKVLSNYQCDIIVRKRYSTKIVRLALTVCESCSVDFR